MTGVHDDFGKLGAMQEGGGFDGHIADMFHLGSVGLNGFGRLQSMGDAMNAMFDPLNSIDMVGGDEGQAGTNLADLPLVPAEGCSSGAGGNAKPQQPQRPPPAPKKVNTGGFMASGSEAFLEAANTWAQKGTSAPPGTQIPGVLQALRAVGGSGSNIMLCAGSTAAADAAGDGGGCGAADEGGVEAKTHSAPGFSAAQHTAGYGAAPNLGTATATGAGGGTASGTEAGAGSGVGAGEDADLASMWADSGETKLVSNIRDDILKALKARGVSVGVSETSDPCARPTQATSTASQLTARSGGNTQDGNGEGSEDEDDQDEDDDGFADDSEEDERAEEEEEARLQAAERAAMGPDSDDEFDTRNYRVGSRYWA